MLEVIGSSFACCTEEEMQKHEQLLFPNLYMMANCWLQRLRLLPSHVLVELPQHATGWE